MTILVVNEAAHDVNVAGNWIFYKVISEVKNAYYRIRTDDIGRELVARYDE